MINKIKHKAYLLGLLLSMNYMGAMAQELSVGDVVTFDFACPKLTHEVQSFAFAPHLKKERIIIGSAEIVKLSLPSEFTNVIWTKISGTGVLVSQGNNEALFQAGLRSGTAIIRATPSVSCNVDITFTIVEPSHITFTKTCGFHRQDVYEAGMFTYPKSIMPDNVSFENISIREEDDLCEADGGLAPFNGLSHLPPGTNVGIWHDAEFLQITQSFVVEKGKGTILNTGGLDEASWSLGIGLLPLASKGNLKYEIPIDFAKSTNLSPYAIIKNKVIQTGSLNGIEMSVGKETESANFKLSEDVKCK